MSAKLSRALRLRLEIALKNAERAHRYIQRPEMLLGITGRPATTTLHYVRASDGATFYSLDKQIGSDLCGLESAIHDLRAILEVQS